MRRPSSVSRTLRLLILRANAVWLGAIALASLALDIAAIFFGRGATAEILAAAPHAGAAFLGNHALAAILAALFWRARARLDLHFAGAAAMAVLGTCNLLFWSIYAAMGAHAMGYATTSVHWLLACAQLAAGICAARERGSV
jgi:hypothetical protein